jgi:hypothetical protein
MQVVLEQEKSAGGAALHNKIKRFHVHRGFRPVVVGPGGPSVRAAAMNHLSSGRWVSLKIVTEN